MIRLQSMKVSGGACLNASVLDAGDAGDDAGQDWS